MRDPHPRRNRYHRENRRSDDCEGSQTYPEGELPTLSQPQQATAFAMRPLECPLPRWEEAAQQQLAIHQDSCFDAPAAVIDELTRPGMTLSARPERFATSISVCIGRHT